MTPNPSGTAPLLQPSPVSPQKWTTDLWSLLSSVMTPPAISMWSISLSSMIPLQASLQLAWPHRSVFVEGGWPIDMSAEDASVKFTWNLHNFWLYGTEEFTWHPWLGGIIQIVYLRFCWYLEVVGEFGLKLKLTKFPTISVKSWWHPYGARRLLSSLRDSSNWNDIQS